jgi:hypothetical protein
MLHSAGEWFYNNIMAQAPAILKRIAVLKTLVPPDTNVAFI